MTRRVAVVPHTHWDREWYEPYQTFRLQLVELIDDLLDMLERDPDFAHFQLDGQMAAVDDYLEIRPERRGEIESLAARGRISMGPWYALPDEFLVSGETLIRNLQLGFASAEQFGGAMKVGYLPDMFGHVSQMPQLFGLFGLTDAVVWRGVPSAIERDAFSWAGPDGTRVRAEYLPQGYGNGARLLDDPKDLVERIRAFEEEYKSLLTGDLLWMNGTDHQMPSGTLPRIVAEANSIQDDYQLEIMSLAAYLSECESDVLATWSGELRSGARANLLMGVASNRVDVKQAAAEAERVLEREAEPLTALFADEWPTRLLERAWLSVIRNSAHDSVCACSHDEVCDAVNHRYHEAIQIGGGLRDRATQAAVDKLALPGGVIVNPSRFRRSGVVELDLPGEGEPDGHQLVTQHPPEMVLDFANAEGRQIVKALLDWEDGWHSAEVGLVDGVVGVTVHRDESQPERVVSRAVVAQMDTLDEVGELAVRIRMTMPPVRSILTHVVDVPGFGWQRWAPAELSVRPVTASGGVLDNGLLRVEIDPDTGTFSVNGHDGLGRLVDGGDTGDTYNYNPPGTDTVVDTPDRVSVTVVESGPLRARLAVSADHNWPASAMTDQRVGEVKTSVRTIVELRAGEELVRVQVDLDNQSRDHRLRAHFPLPEPAAESEAECAFTTVSRGLEAEGGPSERGLPTYPSRRFVRAGGLTVLHDGLLEYELVEIADGRAHEVALTLLRCTGMLSQIPMPYRPLPAGPLTPLEGPQMAGRQRLRYAVHIGGRDPYELADEAWVPLRVAVAPGGGDRPDSGTALDVTGAQVSALTRDGEGRLCVRLFNPTDEPTTARVAGRSGSVVDLLGCDIGSFDGTVELGPHAIITVALD